MGGSLYTETVLNFEILNENTYYDIIFMFLGKC